MKTDSTHPWTNSSPERKHPANQVLEPIRKGVFAEHVPYRQRLTRQCLKML
jgi:hypothetical protein